MKEVCCIPLCQLFLKKDESLQKKAASFISKYGDASSSTLQEALLSYQSEMFQSVQDILVSFMKQPAEETGLPETTFQEKVRICREDNRIPFPANKEDFLFQLSRLNRLEQVLDRADAVAVLEKFRRACDKQDAGFVVALPQFLRQFHAAFSAHQNIQTKQRKFFSCQERIFQFFGR